jgi:hypothetical protein
MKGFEFGIMGIDLSTAVPVELIDASTAGAGLTFKYFITNAKVGIQVYTTEKVFRANIADSIRAGLEVLCMYITVVEYVPEVNSWYAEMKALPVNPTPAMIESLLSKIVAAQVGNGNKDG